MAISDAALRDRAELALFEKAGRDLGIRLNAFFYGRKATGPEIRYPLDWWQAVKARWFPRWLLRRYPVRYVVLLPEMTELFPDIAPVSGQRSIVLREFSSARIVTTEPKP